MDLAVYARVVWRFKFVVLGGFLLAIVLATFSVAKVSFSHGVALTYRKPQTYQSSRTVLITQKGFPWGSLNFSQQQAGHLSSLPAFYAQLVGSSPILARLHLSPDQQGVVTGRPVVDNTTGYGISLPLLRIYALASSPSGAVALAARATNVFISYIAQQQQASNIPAASRILLKVVDPPQPAVVAVARKKTLPIMIFLLVVSATLGAAFVLENLRPAVRVLPGAIQDEPPAKPQQPALEARVGE